MTSVCDRLQQQRQQLTAELATRDRDDSEPLPMSTRLRAMISVRNLKSAARKVKVLLDPHKRRCSLCGGSGERVVTAEGGAHRVVDCRPCGGSGRVDAQ